jgi:hypothetical protein
MALCPSLFSVYKHFRLNKPNNCPPFGDCSMILLRHRDLAVHQHGQKPFAELGKHSAPVTCRFVPCRSLIARHLAVLYALIKQPSNKQKN